MNRIIQLQDTKIVNPIVEDCLKTIIDFQKKVMSDFIKTYDKSENDKSDYELESTCETSLLTGKLDTMLGEFLNEIDDFKENNLEEVK